MNTTLLLTFALSQAFAAEPAPAEDPPPEAPPVEGWTRIGHDETPSTGLITAYGALYGAYAGGMSAWLVGEALEEDENDHTSEGVALGLGAGGAIGATTANLLNRAHPRDVDSVVLLHSGTALGWYYGEELGRLLIPPSAPGANERIRATGLAGTMAGVGVGTAFGRRASSPGHQIHFVAANGVGWLVGRGVGDLSSWDRVEDRRLAAATELGSSLAFGTLAAVANRTELDAPRPGTVGLATMDGLWFGAWSPYLITDEPTARQLGGATQLGLGLGYAAGMGMTAFGQPTGKSIGLQSLGLAAGSALGAGVPLSLGGEGPARAVVGPMLGAGVAGQVLGAAIAPHYQVEKNDRLLLATLETWTVYQAVGWSTFARHSGASNSEALGHALAAGGAGTLATMALVPALDVTPQGSVMLLSGGAWGTWFGAWGSQIANGDADELWLASLSAGDGAMLASALAQGVGWKPTWRQAASVNGYGLLGAAAGGLVGTIALYDPDDWTPVSTSVVVGSGAGLVAGGVLSALPSRRERSADASVSQARPRFAARLPFDTRAQALPWTGDDGSPGLWVQLDLTER